MRRKTGCGRQRKPLMKKKKKKEDGADSMSRSGTTLYMDAVI